MMLVEINLLPKKEHKKSSMLIIAIAGIFLFTITFSIVFFQGNSYEKKMASFDKQIESMQKLNEVQQAKLAEGESGNSAVKLQDAVIWAEQYPFDTVPLLQNIIALLPERGFIQNFEYSNTDSVVIKIQLDASRDAAFYLSSLKGSDWVEDVTLMNIVAGTKAEGTAVEITDTPSEQEEVKVLPRYSAEFEITFKTEFFKEDKGIASKGGDGT
jgi:type IV pilus assembly protein PilN